MYYGVEPHHKVEAEGKFHYWQIKGNTTEAMTKKLIKDFDIDVVQLHNDQYIGTDGIKYAQSIGIPTIWVMHDFWPLCHQRFFTKVWQADSEELCYSIDEYKCNECVTPYYTTLTKRMREVINNCDMGIVPSEKIKKMFEDCGVLKGKLRIVEPWIDLSLFKPQPVPQKPWQVLFASGNYIPHKGINVLLRAWDLVQRRLPQASLIAIGDDRCARESIALAKTLKLQNVNFIGRVEQNRLNSMYTESAVTIFPSIWEETIGLVWLESLACGTPVICSETGSIPELLKYGGELFPPRDHVALAEKIVDMLLSPGKRQLLARQGMNYVNQNFQPSRAGRDFTQIYHELEARKIDEINNSK
jgi:glycosyltransferase involved in cell wall biosynthesis